MENYRCQYIFFINFKIAAKLIINTRITTHLANVQKKLLEYSFSSNLKTNQIKFQ